MHKFKKILIFSLFSAIFFSFSLPLSLFLYFFLPFSFSFFLSRRVPRVRHWGLVKTAFCSFSEVSAFPGMRGNFGSQISKTSNFENLGNLWDFNKRFLLTRIQNCPALIIFDLRRLFSNTFQKSSTRLGQNLRNF